jgi:hypothetical protein
VVRRFALGTSQRSPEDWGQGEHDRYEEREWPYGIRQMGGYRGEGDTRDTIDTKGRGTKTGAELRHLRSIFSSTTSADSSLIFTKSASRADSTEGEGGIAISTTVERPCCYGWQQKRRRRRWTSSRLKSSTCACRRPRSTSCGLFAPVPLVPDPGVNGGTNDDQQWYKYAGGDFSLGIAGALFPKVVNGVDAGSNLSIILIALGAVKMGAAGKSLRRKGGEPLGTILI